MAAADFLGKFVGAGSIFEQFFIWNVMGQVVGAALGPELLVYQERVNAAHPEQPLAPPDLADAVIRNYMTADAAAAEAAKSGLNRARFDVMVPLHGDAPGPQQLVAALLRGIIPEQGAGPDAASFEQGVKESRLAGKWTDMIRQLGQAVLSPPDAASAQVRNFLDPATAAAEAAKTGVDAATFATLTHLAADAPAPGQLAEALRRGLIGDLGTGPDAVTFQQGIAEGRLGDKWTDMIRGLSKLWPTPVDALGAALKGQLTPDQGQAMYELLGGDPQFYAWLLASQGEGPTPLEAVDMARRGIIPWDGTGPDVVSYAQAFRESRFRDKWQPVYQAAAAPLPTEGEITEFLRYNIIDKPTAATLLAQRGITGDYAGYVLDYAEAVSTYDFRGLTLSSVTNALASSIITEDNARQILTSMHVSDNAANLLISYTLIQRAVQQVSNAITHIGSLYTARKITADTARSSLAQLNLDAAAAAEIMQTWDLEASITVRTLTEAQIVDAWNYGIFTSNEAMGELQTIGYTPFDAWALLSIKAKGPQPGKPAAGPPPPLPGVTPGTT